MKRKSKQGKNAAINGRAFEEQCLNELVRVGFTVINNREYITHKNKLRKTFGEKILVKNATYKSVYRTNSRTEFMIIWYKRDVNGKWRKQVFPIECKYQKKSGTVDEKFPFLLESLLSRKEKNIAMVCEIPGAREFAKEYISGGWKKSIAANGHPIINPAAYSDKHIKVMDFYTFKKWIQHKFQQ